MAKVLWLAENWVNISSYTIILLVLIYQYYYFLQVIECHFLFSPYAQSHNVILLPAFVFVSDCLLLAINDVHIKASVAMYGTRPTLDAITGPAVLLSFAKKWIAQCWHESPDERPLFDCK